jgi:hypothetical protein
MNLNRIPVIDDIKSAFISCLQTSNLFIIKLLINNNIINITELQLLLKNTSGFICNETIIDYFVQIGLDLFDLETLQSLFELYMRNGWYNEEFIKLVKYGIRSSGSEINYLRIPDDIFFTYFADENYEITKNFFTYCAKYGTVNKFKKLINLNCLDTADYYLCCMYSLYNPNIDMYEYFLSYLSNDRTLLFIFFLECCSHDLFECYGNKYEKIKIIFTEKLFPLSTQEILLSLLVVDNNNINIISRLRKTFLELTNIETTVDPKSYFNNFYIKNNSLYTIYCQLNNEIERLRQVVPENNIRIIDNWLSQCTILLHDLN